MCRGVVFWSSCFGFLFFLPALSVTLGWILLLAPDHGILNQIWKKFFTHERTLRHFFLLGHLLLGTVMKLFGFFHVNEPRTLANWLRVLDVFHTLIMGTGAAIGGVVLFSLIAYMTVRSNFPGKALLDLLSWLPITLPGILVVVGLMWLFLGTPIFRPFYGSIVLLIIATVISGMPLMTPVLVIVGIVNFIAAARDISHIVLLATHRSRTLALL